MLRRSLRRSLRRRHAKIRELAAAKVSAAAGFGAMLDAAGEIAAGTGHIRPSCRPKLSVIWICRGFSRLYEGAYHAAQ